MATAADVQKVQKALIDRAASKPDRAKALAAAYIDAATERAVKVTTARELPPTTTKSTHISLLVELLDRFDDVPTANETSRRYFESHNRAPGRSSMTYSPRPTWPPRDFSSRCSNEQHGVRRRRVPVQRSRTVTSGALAHATTWSSLDNGWNSPESNIGLAATQMEAMSYSLNLLSILANAADVAEPKESDSMTRAKELLDLVKSPTAIATTVLLAFTTSQLNLNDAGTVNDRRTFWALISASLGTLLAATVVAVMTPLAFRVVVTNWGNGIETRLVVYTLTYLVALGTTVYALSIVNRALLHKGIDLQDRLTGGGAQQS